MVFAHFRLILDPFFDFSRTSLESVKLHIPPLKTLNMGSAPLKIPSTVYTPLKNHENGLFPP